MYKILDYAVRSVTFTEQEVRHIGFILYVIHRLLSSGVSSRGRKGRLGGEAEWGGVGMSICLQLSPLTAATCAMYTNVTCFCCSKVLGLKLSPRVFLYKVSYYPRMALSWASKFIRRACMPY